MTGHRETRPHVLIAAFSARAMAESAARAGFPVTAVDAFGDLDQHPRARVLSLARDLGLPQTIRAAARAAPSLAGEVAVYGAGFENRPAAVAALASGRELWGNAPDVLRVVRDPWRLARSLRRRGFRMPVLRRVGSADRAPTRPGPRGWLVKRRASGGGQYVRAFNPRERVPRGSYLQEVAPGVPGSVAFVAARRRAVVLGISRQLVGNPAFGADGYLYCGSILDPSGGAPYGYGAEAVRKAVALVSVVAEEFDLVGVNGVDFLAQSSELDVLEVNPRWTASMELVERAYGLSVFQVHADACARGLLPPLDVVAARSSGPAFGKAIVFARHDVSVGNTGSWLGDDTVRDVPPPGTPVAAGRPVCTVFARGRDASACYEALVRRARCVHDELRGWASGAASAAHH